MLRDLVVKNLWLKVFSLVLATLIWLAVGYKADVPSPLGSATARTVREFELLPVGLLSSSVDCQPSQIEPSHVTVRLSGDFAAIQALQLQQLRAFVQLLPGQKAAGAFAVEVMVPRGIAIVSVTPNAVVLRPLESP